MIEGNANSSLLPRRYCINQASKTMHNNNFKIEERRRKVASMLAQSMTETETADRKYQKRIEIPADADTNTA
jgi:hypothetical protein